MFSSIYDKAITRLICLNQYKTNVIKYSISLYPQRLMLPRDPNVNINIRSMISHDKYLRTWVLLFSRLLAMYFDSHSILLCNAQLRVGCKSRTISSTITLLGIVVGGETVLMHKTYMYIAKRLARLELTVSEILWHFISTWIYSLENGVIRPDTDHIAGTAIALILWMINSLRPSDVT